MLRLCGAAAPSAEEQSFGMRTVAAAVGALQIEISNVHVRYEDETSDPSSPFAFGLTLDRLSSLSLSLSLSRARALSVALSLSPSHSLSLSLSPPHSLSLHHPHPRQAVAVFGRRPVAPDARIAGGASCGGQENAQDGGLCHVLAALPGEHGGETLLS